MPGDLPELAYSAVADTQLDDMVDRDPDLYDSVADVLDQLGSDPGQVRRRSSAITTREGIRFVTPVSGRYPYKVFWSMEAGEVRIEAVFPKP